jgi:hypothetical protein
MSVNGFFITIKTSSSEEVVNKITTEAQWKDDFMRIFDHLNKEKLYSQTIDENTKTMTIYESTEVVKKGWVYNSTQKKNDTICTLNLIKIHHLNITEPKVVVIHTESQTDEEESTQTILEPIEEQPEIEETDDTVRDFREPLFYDLESQTYNQYQHQHQPAETEFDCAYYQCLQPTPLYPPGLTYNLQTRNKYSVQYSDSSITASTIKTLCDKVQDRVELTQEEKRVYAGRAQDYLFIEMGEQQQFRCTPQAPFPNQLVNELKDRLYQNNFGLSSNGYKML